MIRFPLADDFTGHLANNTNLAAQGRVALQAYSYLCQQVRSLR